MLIPSADTPHAECPVRMVGATWCGIHRLVRAGGHGQRLLWSGLTRWSIGVVEMSVGSVAGMDGARPVPEGDRSVC